jgi:HSP20 family molecular chaperone IbpA
MSRLREFGESAATAVLERVGRGVGRVQERTPLPYDLLESDDAYLVVFDVPGATRSDVQVRFVDGRVQVQVDRFREFHEGFEMRFPGRGLSLDGAADLPDDAAVDAEAAGATLTDEGTLEVRVPKAPGGARDVAVADERETDAADEPERVAIDEGAHETGDAEGDGDEAGDDHADETTHEDGDRGDAADA